MFFNSLWTLFTRSNHFQCWPEVIIMRSLLFSAVPLCSPAGGQKTVIGVIVCTSGERSLWPCLLSSVRMSSSVVVNCCCASGCRLVRCDLMWSLIMAEICCCSLAKFWIWCQHWEMQVWLFCILLSVVWWMSCVGPGLCYLYPLRESTDWCLGERPYFVS